ncbi:hypothetical protein VFPPC_13741 [Pochonia chlamydosporia 170]|uniref:DUF1857-domain-containing protein n=1 Tax=Pochonia chlamydosporia 170 TaxID=1380566 RepID=A0A179FUR9_METCM|nr:hypothetical protein VFPPC_13741 [Pochonia chlamydosporia 170]OAQ68851.2 hypothetical protein VFPPC_13741 [Pochonia chlamydosporia 170]
MPTINVAATVPINPPNTTPLTHGQVWAGLRRKIRTPRDFVPVIKNCDIISDENGLVSRRVVFEGGKTVMETCREYAPNRIHFTVDDGSEVQNVISLGQDGNLYLTYSFSWKLEGVVDGGETFQEEEAKNQNMAIAAVTKSIEAIREMVADGRIQ